MSDVVNTMQTPADLAALLDLPVALDDEGAAMVSIDAALDVTIDRSRDGDEILLVSDLGRRIAGPAGHAVLLDLLDRNARLAATATGAYALEPEDRSAVLIGRRPAEGLDAERFLAWFDAFAEAALIGRDLVQEADPQPLAEEDESEGHDDQTTGILDHAGLAEAAGDALIGLA